MLLYNSISMFLYKLLNKRLSQTFFNWNTPVTIIILKQISQKKAQQIAT
jgi:hypothetical protein